MNKLTTNQSQLPLPQQWYDMKKAAKLINAEMGRTKLFRYLRDAGFLMEDNEPYQHYVDRGLFKVTIKNIYGRYGQLMFRSIVTLVSEIGINVIKSHIEKNAHNDGSGLVN